MANVQYIGLDEVDIDRYTRELLKKHVLRELQHFGRDLIIHIKEYKRKGTQHKYSVHMRLNDGQVVPAHAHSWNIISAVDKCFDKLASEL